MAVHIIKPNNGLQRLGIPQVWDYLYLLKLFIMRAIRARYRPTALGYGWVVLRPALLCAVYVLVFGFLLGVRTTTAPFAVFVFLGIVLFLFFANGISDSAASLTGNAGIMSKVYYPRLLVPLSAISVNLLDLFVALGIVGVLMLLYGVIPNWQILYAPLFLLGIIVFTFAVGLILAARSVRVRDVTIVLPVLMRIAIYTMPCVYPVTLVPENLLDYYYLNPMAALVQGFRWALWGDVWPPLWSLIWAGGICLIALLYGLRSFNSVERTMVDTL